MAGYGRSYGIHRALLSFVVVLLLLGRGLLGVGLGLVLLLELVLLALRELGGLDQDLAGLLLRGHLESYC
jgi:hypothetical protein